VACVVLVTTQPHGCCDANSILMPVRNIETKVQNRVSSFESFSDPISCRDYGRLDKHINQKANYKVLYLGAALETKCISSIYIVGTSKFLLDLCSKSGINGPWRILRY